MGSITGYTSAALKDISDTTITGASINEMGNLILITRYGARIDAGYVKGSTGIVGPDRPLIAGVISIFGGSTPPTGWMFCDGAAVSRTTYSELFAAIGTTYGTGDGSTTFNLPDLKGRVPVGLDLTQTEFDVLGEKGGEKAHLLTTAEIPSHTHTIKGYSGVDDSNFTGLNGAFAASDAVTPFDQQTQPTGGGTAHNNLQPYNVVNFIISIGNAGINPVPAENLVGVGTTAQRNAIFGVPSTDPQMVDLANRKIIWFNTDLGWEESYYATTGKTGLTALGLVTGAPSGWFPTGSGPAMLWEAQTAYTPGANAFLGNWGWVRKRGGSTWWDAQADGTKVKVLKWGRYAVRGWTTQGTGSGTSNWHLRIQAPDAVTTILNVDGNAFPQHPALYTRIHIELDDMIMQPNQYVGMITTNGGTQVHVGSSVMGQFSVRYLGPPLTLE
jgi:microcystin-dependent protein